MRYTNRLSKQTKKIDEEELGSHLHLDLLKKCLSNILYNMYGGPSLPNKNKNKKNNKIKQKKNKLCFYSKKQTENKTVNKKKFKMYIGPMLQK